MVAKEFDLFCVAFTWVEVYVTGSLDKSWQFIIAGVVMLGIGVLLLFWLVSRP